MTVSGASQSQSEPSTARSPQRTVVIGVAGGTASGKTTLVDQLAEHAGADQVAVLRQDSYYRDQPELSIEERRAVNYDHPDALDMQLLAEHVRELRAGHAIEVPTYDFASFSRRPETARVEPQKVLIVEGILILAVPAVRELLDLKIFVDADHDLRLLRRLRRDVEERGRTFDSVTRRYLEQVRPMHLQYVDPSKEHADIVVQRGGLNHVVIGMLTSLIELRNWDRRARPRGRAGIF